MGINEQNINQQQITMKNINIENIYNKDYLEKDQTSIQIKDKKTQNKLNEKRQERTKENFGDINKNKINDFNNIVLLILSWMILF